MNLSHCDNNPDQSYNCYFNTTVAAEHILFAIAPSLGSLVLRGPSSHRFNHGYARGRRSNVRGRPIRSLTFICSPASVRWLTKGPVVIIPGRSSVFLCRSSGKGNTTSLAKTHFYPSCTIRHPQIKVEVTEELLCSMPQGLFCIFGHNCGA